MRAADTEGPTRGESPRLRLRRWAGVIRRDVIAIYFAARDPRVPWYAKVLAVIVAGYALSPIDLIPDFIPVLGYLDDLVLVPAGILLVRRLIPAEVLAEHRERADVAAGRPTSRAAAVVIVGIWLVALAAATWLVWPLVAARVRRA